MNAMTGIRMKSPAHPGGFIKHEIIEPLALTVTAAARALGVTRAAAHPPCSTNAPACSPEMALRVEKSRRRLDGYADADAEQLRHRADASARGGDRGGAVCRKSSLQ